MKQIVIFASGSGSNAENIIRYFSQRNNAKVVRVFTNNSRATVLERCERHRIDTHLFNREALLQTNEVRNALININPDLIVLAGFLLKIPSAIISSFPNKIINIHPALLPKYGGKGMYGMHVHKAVVSNKEIEAGITIHYVNKNYDEGAMIFQVKCKISSLDTPESVAAKIHTLEMQHFPVIINSLLND